MTVQIFIKIVWTFFENLEIFIERSGERKKRHDCISRNLFPTPKNEESGVQHFPGFLH